METKTTTYVNLTVEELATMIDKAVEKATVKMARMIHEEPLPENCTVKQAAEYLQVSQSCIRNWITGKVIPYNKAGNRVLIKRETLEEMANQRNY